MRVTCGRRHAVCALLCLFVDSIFARPEGSVHDELGLETRQTFEEIVDDEAPRGISYPKKLIPIKEPRISRNFMMRSTPLDPDAEMLPAHYTGVKSPGVDHMELRYGESQVTKVGPKVTPRKNARAEDHEASGTMVSKNEKDAEVYEKAATVEKGQNGNYLKGTEQSQHVESGGNTKVRDSGEESSARNAEQARGNKEAKYQKKDNGHVDRKTAGYRNVYHKDEYMKDHDFYENDDHGGHHKNHGEYKEKYVATEGRFKKGASRDSASEEADIRKKGATGNSQVAEESKGHRPGNGYDQFFKNFQGFAKQAD